MICGRDYAYCASDEAWYADCCVDFLLVFYFDFEQWMLVGR